MPKFRDELAGPDVITRRKTWFRGWIRYAKASSGLNATKQDCAKAAAKMKGCLAKLKAEQEAFALRVKELKKQPFSNNEEGMEYTLSSKDAMKKFHPYTDPPDPSWMDVLHPMILREYGIVAEERDTLTPMPQKGVTPSKSGRTGYTLPGLENASLALAGELGATAVREFLSDKKGGPNQDIKSQIKQANPRNEGESDRDYGQRISRLTNEAKQGKSD